MRGKLYRRNKDGYIYEVIGEDTTSSIDKRWILWNERVGEGQYVPGIELQRQVGWELVGTAANTLRETSAREAPPALMR